MLLIFFNIVLAMYSPEDGLCLSLSSLSRQRQDISNYLPVAQAESRALTLAIWQTFYFELTAEDISTCNTLYRQLAFALVVV